MKRNIEIRRYMKTKLLFALCVCASTYASKEKPTITFKDVRAKAGDTLVMALVPAAMTVGCGIVAAMVTADPNTSQEAKKFAWGSTAAFGGVTALWVGSAYYWAKRQIASVPQENRGV